MMTTSNDVASLSKAVNPWENKDPKIESLVFVLLKQFRQMKYLKLEGGSELGLVSGEVLLGLLLKSPVLKTLAFKVYWVLVYVEAKGVLPTTTLTEQQQISNLVFAFYGPRQLLQIWMSHLIQMLLALAHVRKNFQRR
ncbi:hypothetical protein JHK87_037310 [Glycine soja]|nr:hypothetical protein JHK87_037310 [Glycine soja]